MDEASQMPVDHFMSSLQFIHKPYLSIIPPEGIGVPHSKITELDKIKNLSLGQEKLN